MLFVLPLSQALSGQPFSGPDIGGFAGNASPLLFARWMGIGALLPFARGHSEKGTKDAEPWSFGPEVSMQARVSESLWDKRLMLCRSAMLVVVEGARTKSIP